MWSVWHVQTQITLHGLAGWFTRQLWMETRSFTFHFADFQTEFSRVDHGGFVSLPLVLQSILINRSLSGWRIDAAASTCSQELRRNVTRLASLLLFAALCICWSLSDEAVIGDQRVTGYISVTSHDLTNLQGDTYGNVLVYWSYHRREEKRNKTMQACIWGESAALSVMVKESKYTSLWGISGETCLKPCSFDMSHTKRDQQI